MAVVPICPVGPDDVGLGAGPESIARPRPLAGVIESSRPRPEQIRRFDDRPDRLLREVIRDHPVALERERAVWEYADRKRSESVPLLTLVAHQDADPAVRCGTLWALRKMTVVAGADAIAPSLRDDHPEVRDWAALFLREVGAAPPAARELSALRFNPANPFDQTMPLLASGYAQVLVPPLGYFRVTLSPLWFESVMGRMMACLRSDTVKTDLILEKRLAHYHPDGSHHYQMFRFQGFTRDLGADVCYHRYESQARHTFYPSGKIEDTSVPPVGNAVVRLRRSVTTLQARLPHDRSRKVVRSLRGRSMGSAFTNVNRVLSNGMQIGPGEVQVVSYHNPVLASLSNTFLSVTFRGKLSDLDGDGCLDVNTERCHGTSCGELDLDLDGVADCDPFDACSC